MIALLLFLNLTLYERFANFSIGYMQIGLGELFYLGYLLLLFLAQKKVRVPLFFFNIALIFFVVIFFSIWSNNTTSGFNTLVTVPLKVILAGIFTYRFTTIEPRNWHLLAVDSNIALNILFLIFFSDAPIVQFVELFNRNELLAYTVCLFGIRAAYIVFFIPSHAGNSKLLWIPLFVLLVISVLAQSRQLFLAILVAGLVSFMYSEASLRARLLSLLLFSIFVSSSVFMIFRAQLSDYQQARIETIQNFDPATRADKQRLSNIQQGLDGMVERPYLGHGPTSFRADNLYNKVAHNTYITLMYELGLVGLLVFLLPFHYAFRTKKTSDKGPIRKLVRMSLQTYIVIFLVQCFFIESLGKATFYINLVFVALMRRPTLRKW